MEAFKHMMEAGNFLPEHILPWLTWMQVILFLGPVIFIKYKASRYLLLAQLANILTAYCVFVFEGEQVTKLFGLGHLFWLWPAYYFFKDIKSEHWKIYRIFAGLAFITIIISLVFDVRDIALWIAGDRASVLVMPDI